MSGTTMWVRTLSAVFLGASLLAATGCATGPARVPPPPPAAAAPASSPPPSVAVPAAALLPPPAESLPSFPLVRDEPSVAAAAAALAAAPEAARPAALLRRAQAAVALAQKIRVRQGNTIHVPGWAPDYERFIACYDLAARDLGEIIAAHPSAPEAAEAMYTMGQIHDNPHLDLFDEALEWYHLAVERYPDTPWAQKAAERIALIEEIMNAGADTKHRPPQPPDAAR